MVFLLEITGKDDKAWVFGAQPFTCIHVDMCNMHICVSRQQMNGKVWVCIATTGTVDFCGILQNALI